MSHEDDQVRIVDCDAVEPAELQDSRPEVVEANPVDARTALLTHLLKRVNVSSTSARLGCFAGASIDACKRWVRQDSMRRVAVTGIGVVSPLGNSPARAIENAFAGRSGIRTLDVAFAHRLRAPLGATVQFDGALHFDMPKLRMLDRFSLFALFAANQAMAEAGGVTHELDRSRAGAFIGNGMGGTHSMDDGYQTLYGEKSDRIKPFTILLGMTNAAAAWIGIEHEFRGPVPTYSTACSSSAVAQANDAVESAAVEVVFGPRAHRIPMSATKAMHGHLLGAAGALECVLSLLAMKRSVALPTMHLQEPDPQCDLDYVPNVARHGLAIRTMLSNSFAFGGANAVLVLRA